MSSRCCLTGSAGIELEGRFTCLSPVLAPHHVPSLQPLCFWQWGRQSSKSHIQGRSTQRFAIVVGGHHLFFAKVLVFLWLTDTYLRQKKKVTSPHNSNPSVAASASCITTARGAILARYASESFWSVPWESRFFFAFTHSSLVLWPEMVEMYVFVFY